MLGDRDNKVWEGEARSMSGSSLEDRNMQGIGIESDAAFKSFSALGSLVVVRWDGQVKARHAAGRNP